MRKSLKFVLLAGYMTMSAQSFAGAGFRGDDKVAEISINFHNQGVALRFQSAISLNGCSSDTEVIINRTTAGYSEMYSAILAAYTAKKTINVWVSGACENNRNVVTAIVVKD